MAPRMLFTVRRAALHPPKPREPKHSCNVWWISSPKRSANTPRPGPRKRRLPAPCKRRRAPASPRQIAGACPRAFPQQIHHSPRLHRVTRNRCPSRKWAIPHIAAWVKQSAQEILTLLQSTGTTEQQRKEAGHQVWQTSEQGHAPSHQKPPTACGRRSSNQPTSNISANPTKHLPPSFTQPLTSIEPRPSTALDFSTSLHCSPIQHTSIQTMAPPIPASGHPPRPIHYAKFISPNSIYIKIHFNSHDTQRCYHQHGHFYVGSIAIDIPLTESATEKPNSSNFLTTHPYQQNFHYAIGTLQAPSPTTPRSTSPAIPTTTKPGSTNTFTLHLPMATHTQLAVHLTTPQA